MNYDALAILSVSGICLLFGSIIAYILYKYVKSENIYLYEMEIPDKEEVLQLMNIHRVNEKIDIERIEIPKIYNSKFYRIFFLTHTTNDVISDNELGELRSNYHLLMENQGTFEGKTLYCCTISDYNGKIDELERICDKYRKV